MQVFLFLADVVFIGCLYRSAVIAPTVSIALVVSCGSATCLLIYNGYDETVFIVRLFRCHLFLLSSIGTSPFQSEPGRILLPGMLYSGIFAKPS
jgi:hypothetical protein